MNYEHRVITPRQYEVAAANGIRNRVLEDRVRKLGWSMKDAISKRPGKNVKHGDWPDRAEANGVTRGSYYRRTSQGWSPEKAATTPLRNMVDKHGKPKPTWEDVKERAARNNVSYSTFMQRLSEGETPEEAVTRPPLTRRENMKRQLETGQIKYGVRG
ncbi:hypothetical protein Q0V21_19560 [Paenibacillus sp. 11B]|uniref:hypothetical protein n=1 Tax=unclassified Paenibacillus TaxID=185978 RepID=UPI00265122D1|nr:hypothetical protein [Paenibacillus sp. 11B]MDN8590960.1 hypothetical protein [Paenibacillus sp. 11B]